MNRMHQPRESAVGPRPGGMYARVPSEKASSPTWSFRDEGHVRQQQHGVERMVQGREPAAGVAGHHPPAIDQEKDALALVVLVGRERSAFAAGPWPASPGAAGRLPRCSRAAARTRCPYPAVPDARRPSTLSRSRRASIGVAGNLADVGINPDLGPGRPGDRACQSPAGSSTRASTCSRT